MHFLSIVLLLFSIEGSAVTPLQLCTPLVKRIAHFLLVQLKPEKRSVQFKDLPTLNAELEKIAHRPRVDLPEKIKEAIQILNALPPKITPAQKALAWKEFAQELNHRHLLATGQAFVSEPFPTTDKGFAFIGGGITRFIPDEGIRIMIPVLFIEPNGNVFQALIPPERNDKNRPLNPLDYKK